MNEESLDRGELNKARNYVYRVLKIRIRSEKEIKAKLLTKEFSQDIIKETIKYFKEIDLIDDRRFAKAWIQARLNKPFGLNRIKNELKNKGVDEEILTQEFQWLKNEDEYQETDVVLRLAQRRAKIYKNIDPLKLKQRLFGYLMRRGFSQDSIYKALRQL